MANVTYTADSAPLPPSLLLSEPRPNVIAAKRLRVEEPPFAETNAVVFGTTPNAA
jgi:hypothetical protein